MFALILTLLITIGAIAQFYLKFSPLKSFLCFVSSIIGLIVAFSFYEPLAGFLISKGFLAQWAQSLVFLVLALVSAVLIISLADFIIGSNINFGPAAKVSCAIVFGALTGIIASGIIIISIALTPGKRALPYSRFGDKIITKSPSKPAIPADEIVTSLYSMISGGSMSGKNSFSFTHPNYLDRLHLNRYACKDGVSVVAAKNAVKVDKYGLTKEQISDDETKTVVTLKIKDKPIDKGGAENSDKKLSLIPAQVVMACTGSADSKGVKAFYPVNYQVKGQAVKKDMSLSEVISLDNDAVEKTDKGRFGMLKMYYDIPEGMTPEYIAFKNNTIVKLPKLLTEEEIKQAKEEDEKAALEQEQQ